MNKYKPELGQAVFGQPYKAYEVPEIWDAALSHVRHALTITLWNKHQREIDPFGNTGDNYANSTFEVRAYSWSDEKQPYNFKWRDVEISWYKYLGRGMSANKELTVDEANNMLLDCLNSLKTEGHE